MTCPGNHQILADHTPPPAEPHRVMVREHRRMRLSEPELRAWHFQGIRAWQGSCIRCYCPCARSGKESCRPLEGPVTPGQASVMLDSFETADKQGQRWIWWVGQCPLCRRILWMAEERVAATWRQNCFLNAFTKIKNDKRYNPQEVLCQKPIIDWRAQQKFQQEWRETLAAWPTLFSPRSASFAL